MKSEKIYIKVLQNIGFRLFAVLSLLFLFVAQRLPALSVEAEELRDVTERFSISSFAFGNFAKFFDYFAIPLSYTALIMIVLAAVILMLGAISLGLSLFTYRKVQVVNFFVSLVGTLCSIAFSVLLTVAIYEWRNDIDIDGVLTFMPNHFLIWLPVALFALATLFIYTYAKLPGYRMADGRFFRAMGCALNPKNFPRTFKKDDNTEAIFRSNVPLKKKKYATISEPDSLKKARRSASKSRRKADKAKAADLAEASSKKLSNLELAINKREHAERVANRLVDSENSALLKKKNSKKSSTSKKSNSHASASRLSDAEKRARALEIAKLKAKHAEEIALRNKKI